MSQTLAQRLGIDQVDVALAAEDGIDLSGDQAMAGAAPERLGNRLVEAQADAAAEQPPALGLVSRPAQHRRQQVLLMLQQIGMGEIGRAGADGEGAMGGGDPVALQDQFIEQRCIEAVRTGCSCLDGGSGGGARSALNMGAHS